MGVAVGLSTYDATAALFEYEELEPAALKGKAEPVRVFVARATRGRLGAHLIRTHDNTPYVGRDIDLALLKGLFDKTVATSSVQLVTVVGEPGIGKSRIVAELLEHAQAREPRLTWRQGRCLPYGDGVTFWALGEIVKAQAGILESDDQEAASSKLELTVPDGVDREWMRTTTAPAGRRRCFVGGRTGRAFRGVAHVPRDGRRGVTDASSCSRISTGPTTDCSPSSSTWPIGPRAFRYSSSALRVPSSSSAVPRSPPDCPT